MSSRSSIPVSLVLLAAFLVFNAGMPVYFYLCPMMSDESPACDVSPARASGEVSLTAITPDCCAKVFVADRKTTPFLKSVDENLQNNEVAAVIPAVDSDLSDTSSLFAELHHAPAVSPPPLYLLNSTLLI